MRLQTPASTRRSREGAARFLFEHVEHGLQRADGAVADRLDAFGDPTDRRPERDAELADLALGAQRHERVPERVVTDRLDARVVQLVQVDVVGAEPAEGRFELAPDRLRAEVLRPLALAGLAGRLEVVPALGGEHDLVAMRREEWCEHRLADTTVAVDGRGVDEVDATVERGTQQRLGFVDLPPPVARERPRADPDFGDGQVGVAEAAKAHTAMFRTAPRVRPARRRGPRSRTRSLPAARCS